MEYAPHLSFSYLDCHTHELLMVPLLEAYHAYSTNGIQAVSGVTIAHRSCLALWVQLHVTARANGLPKS